MRGCHFSPLYYSVCNLCYKTIGVTRIPYYIFSGYYSEIKLVHTVFPHIRPSGVWPPSNNTPHSNNTPRTFMYCDLWMKGPEKMILAGLI